jgi:hypothetical protein
MLSMGLAIGDQDGVVDDEFVAGASGPDKTKTVASNCCGSRFDVIVVY